MSERMTIPVLPLREVVLFPSVTAPIGAGRPATLRAIEAALASEDKFIFAVSQRENIEDVSPESLYTIGTVAKVGQVQRGLAGMQLLLHGEHRGIAMEYQEHEGYLQAIVRKAEEMVPEDPDDTAFVALYREARERAAELGHKSGLPDEVVQQVLAGVTDPGQFADLISGYIDIEPAQRQVLLETLSVKERLRRVLVHVQHHVTVLDAQEDIKSQVQEELGERQREMILREQLKTIKQELGEDDEADEFEELRRTLSELPLGENARKEVDRELGRISRISRESMESQVIRTFLENVAELPWGTRSEDHLDLAQAEAILDEDHYALQDVKDRVLEFLAVRQLRNESEAREAEASAEAAAARSEESAPKESAGDEAGEDGSPPPPVGTGNEDDKAPKGPILLFVGPPGVGKTSVAKSIARAMGREYVRISLGGARDEADIRGHRRTYVGAMPGRIIAGMKQAGTKNPVFLLDEVDKLGVSFQGDPASALLEVLDPAQNDSFTDHYLGVPFDLSEVLFIATANFIENIPGPLLDRMEVVEFSGYTDREKLHIARRYLLPRQLIENGLDRERLTVTDEAIAESIAAYTREAGVRQLERELGKLARKVARRIASDEITSMSVDVEGVRDILGRPKVHPEHAAEHDQVGVATGMYYTPAGGDIMFVEASTMRGKSDLVLTGQLGDIMKESARAALTYARTHAAALQIDEEMFERDIHIHVPAGAVPKEGPSAGIAMATAVVSALSGFPARHDIAMTGEITLRGRVLPIGGVKEKILGAVRAGITSVVLPKENEADLEDLPSEVLDTLEIHLVEELGEALALTMRGATLHEGRLLFADEQTDGAGMSARLVG
ncbi:MAG: endopeptidase La [Gemmatimonadetes bacterium]|nr:MAG: endopeptidase La [Gemmatimonadota bacterium]